ncbi:MAG: hypothetical protein INR69_23850 [Mucilaginibacter polytrichastri]|nr:hypothetical protein [Mucilaginibacter polytrichastri]
MTVRYLKDESGKTTDVQLSLEDYMHLLEKANELPEHVKKGIARGLDEASGDLKTTAEVLSKYRAK